MSIEITRYHEFKKGIMLGFLDVLVPVWGTKMSIKGCKVFEKDGKRWVGLPSREYQDNEGKTKYQPLIGLEDEEIYKRFTASLYKAFEEHMKKSAPPPKAVAAPIVPDAPADEFDDKLPF